MKLLQQTVALTVGILGTAAILGESPFLERGWGQAVVEIQRAARVTDSAGRVTALEHALREGLLSTDERTRTEVGSYLSLYRRWLPLVRLESVLQEAQRMYGIPVNRLLDDSELSEGSRTSRMETYRRAIVDGEAVLRRGSKLPRFVALQAAALDGLAELSSVLEANYGLLSASEQEALPYPQIVTTLAMRAGAQDEMDGTRLAAEHIGGMDDLRLRERMEVDAGFREAVLQAAELACPPKVLTHGPAAVCDAFRGIYARQRRLQQSAHEALTASTESVVKVGGDRGEKSWLARFEGATR